MSAMRRVIRRIVFVTLVAIGCAAPLPTSSPSSSPLHTIVRPVAPTAEPTETQAAELPSPTAEFEPSATPVGSREPDAYTFTLKSSCGERALIGTFNVEVQDGETV